MTDAETCLALALAMGAKMDPYRPEREGQIVWPDGRIQLCDPERGLDTTRRFAPIHNGADFDAVLMWARKQPRLWRELCHDEMAEWTAGEDEIFRRAVCQAIVEAL